MATTKVIPGVIDLNQANSESGLRMPKGGAFSGTPAEGMMRNDTSQSSLSSASTMQHYTGNNEWKNFVNTAEDLNVEYLIVAGGGAAGSGEYGGGGGAGGLRSGTSSVTRNANIAVSVGAGGAINASQSTRGNSGADSSVAFPGGTISATGGGGGGARNSNSANAAITQGGSGGSGGGDSLPTTTGGAGNAGGYTPVEGFKGGGNGGNTGYEYGNGGGGAAQEGTTATNPGYFILGAQGGNGASTTIINASEQSTYSVGEDVSGTIYFAGGGAGGGYGSQQDLTRIESGDGNGGKAGYYNNSSASTITPIVTLANTGGGGCGAGVSSNGLAGAAGVIILKYDSGLTCTDESGGTLTGNFDVSSYTSGKKITIIKGNAGNIKFS